MRKILILLGLIVAIGLNAQETIKAKRGSNNYFEYIGVAGDTIYGTGGQNFDFKIDMDEPYFFDAYFDVDTLLVAASNPDVVFKFYGSNDDVTYYQIGSTSITWTGDVDTIVRFNNLTKSIADVNTVAAYNVTGGALGTDTIGTQADTLIYSSRTETHAITETENAVIWKYLRLNCVGGSGARAEFQKAVFAIIPKRYK